MDLFLHFAIDDDPYRCLVVLDAVGRVQHRRSDREVVRGEGIEAGIALERVELAEIDYGDRESEVSFEDFRSAIETHWIALHRARLDLPSNRARRPDRDAAQADLELWEQRERRRHPYRGRIEGIPAFDLD